MNKFSKRSKSHLVNLKTDLQKILIIAIARSKVDFFLYESSRTIAKQREYFNTGASSINPDSYEGRETYHYKRRYLFREISSG